MDSELDDDFDVYFERAAKLDYCNAALANVDFGTKTPTNATRSRRSSLRPTLGSRELGDSWTKKSQCQGPAGHRRSYR